MTEHQRLKGCKARGVDVTEVGRVTPISYVFGNIYCMYKLASISVPCFKIFIVTFFLNNVN